MKALIVGLASPARGGKDMVAGILDKELSQAEHHVHAIRFAEPLKDLISDLFLWDRNKLDDDIVFKEAVDPAWNITPRKALQIIGTDMFREGPLRHYGINIWVDIFKKRAQETSAWWDVILVPDCRFIDEFEMIKSLGGLMIFMDPKPRIWPKAKVHSSERDMWDYPRYDFIIDTGCSMQDTEKEAISLAKNLIERLKGGA